MNNFKIFHLFWEAHNWDNSFNTAYNSDKDYGVYQIYGDHPIYGNDQLLYIGQAKLETYSDRMKGHKDLDTAQIANYSKLYLSYFCKIDKDLSESNWEDAIDIVEKVLIKAHSPALNSKEIMGFLEKDIPNILIYNWGNRGRLLPEVSTLRCSEFYHDSEIYDFANLALSK